MLVSGRVTSDYHLYTVNKAHHCMGVAQINKASNFRDTANIKKAVLPLDLLHLLKNDIIHVSYWLVVEPPISKICSSKWESSPNRDENKKYFKPPPRLFRLAYGIYLLVVYVVFVFHQTYLLIYDVIVYLLIAWSIWIKLSTSLDLGPHLSTIVNRYPKFMFSNRCMHIYVHIWQIDVCTPMA